MERELKGMIDEIRNLPRDKRGFPVPKFVAFIDGEPDFRVIAPGFVAKAYKERLCWICGGKMGKSQWVVMGPMCTVTRTTSEPGCHKGCAHFAVLNCPFLTTPMARRNDRNLPEDVKDPAGLHIGRNPGVTAIWECAEVRPFPVGEGVLFKVGDPKSIEYWREGRRATEDEVAESVSGGLPTLIEAAEHDGPLAMLELKATVNQWADTLSKLGVFDAAKPA
jgi:hypothetical protein